MKIIMLRSNSLNLSQGGTSGVEIPYAPIPLDAQSNVVVSTALKGETLNIADAYASDGVDFAGTHAFDKEISYHSTSLLNIPLKNSEDKVIGVMQYVNATDSDSGQVIPFDAGLQTLLESLSWLATVALEAYRREASLYRKIEELRIEVDQAKKQQQVSEIVDSDYFQNLAAKAKSLRKTQQATED